MENDELRKMYFGQLCDMLKQTEIKEAVIVFRDKEGIGVMHVAKPKNETGTMTSIGRGVAELLKELHNSENN